MTERPSVLIVGGGIAGLALAGFLAQQGREPTVVERASWRRTGYGIGLWGEGIEFWRTWASRGPPATGRPSPSA